MSQMITLLNSLVGLGICMILGYVSRKTKIINDEISAGISNFLFLIALPCLILIAMQREFSPEFLTDSIIIFFAFFGIFAIGYGFGRLLCFLCRVPKQKMGVWLFGLTMPNVTYMGLPVISSLYGNDGIFYVTIAGIAFNLVAFSVGDSISLTGVDKKHNSNLKALLFNPPLIATLVGLVMFVTSIKLPQSLNYGIEMLGNITMPLSMVLIGSSLAKTPLLKSFFAGKLYFAVFTRLLIIPSIVFLLLCPFIQNKTLLGTIIIITAMPAAALTVIIAERFNCNIELASQFVAISTILCVVTIPVISFLIYL